ncbi:ectonucleoside triphosphate diphosphohydrolase 5 isoform X1 [Onthophagus taurus]|uniref:ectonucleoside triphosphate diphosphohydrolase 5 isoform X1 n=1 Tax=Onthophagus taurus TaxID=166361 RepID=UPI0039BE71D4
MNNSGLRRRKEGKEQNGKQVRHRKSKKPETSGLQKSLFCLILSAMILTIFTIMYIDYIPSHLKHIAIDKVAKALGYHKPVHAVVIDAGSTGSRVLAFTFHKAYLDDHLILDKELFEFTKPGLSFFADKPEEGAASIASLIEKAKKEIPQQYWSSTPLILKATAGLRLLPEDKADGLLNAVRKLFKETPFITNDESVAIMDGVDEGIFSWFTVNFLLDKFYDPKTTVAALDLGGGSTQVTFYPATPSSLAAKEYIHDALTPAGTLPVYTHSYLGLGLMAARKHIITLNQPEKTEVTSSCINHVVKNKKFHFAGKDYFVSGPDEKYQKVHMKGDETFVDLDVPVINYKECSGDIIKYVSSIAKPLAELPALNIFAFSYYFDRASEVGLIDEAVGGRIKLNEFEKAAQNACNTANVEQPFMCLDLTFIWALLHKGFGLGPDTTIYLYKKINGHEISWALGAAHHILN